MFTLVVWTSTKTYAFHCSDTLTLTKGIVQQALHFDTLRFRYHAGDNPIYAHRFHDDTAWQILRNDSLGTRLLHDGIGWLRTYIRIQQQQALSVMLSLYVPWGAGELYLNDSLVYTSGEPSSVAEREIQSAFYFHHPPKIQYVLLPDSVYSVAIRVSVWGRHSVRRWLWWDYSNVVEDVNVPGISPTPTLAHGIRGVLADEYFFHTIEQEGQRPTIIVAMSSGIAILMVLLLGYLYSRDRLDKTTLYIALFIFSTLMTSAIYTIAIFFVSISTWTYRIGIYVNTIGMATGIVWLLCSARTYFYHHIGRRYLVLIISSMICFFVIYTQPFIPSFQKYSYALQFVLGGTTLYVVARGMMLHQKSKQAWIMGIGISACCLYLIELSSIPMIFNGRSDALPFPFVSLALYYFGIPITITIQIVNRVVQDRMRLARYSTDLEEQVRTRTAELVTVNTELSEKNTIIEHERNELERINQELDSERDKSEILLRNILPITIAERMKRGETSIAEYFPEVCVLFADVVGFTALSQHVSPQKLVMILDAVFTAFDHIAEDLQLEKIKTIGDAYMVVGGVPLPLPDSTHRMAHMAQRMHEAIAHVNQQYQTHLHIRIGIHTGNVVAGVIGKKKFAYDIWGDTVNTASRMESHGEAGKIHISSAVFHILRDTYHCTSRGMVDIKGKGMMETWFLEYPRASSS